MTALSRTKDNVCRNIEFVSNLAHQDGWHFFWQNIVACLEVVWVHSIENAFLFMGSNDLET